MFADEYSKLDGKITNTESFSASDTDFKTQLLKIKQSKPKGLLVIAIDMQYINIIKQIRELNVNSEIFAPVTFDNKDILSSLGDAANGVIYSRPFYDPAQKNIKMTNFIKKYQEEKNKEPSLLTALGYDSYDIIVNCLHKNENNINATKEYLYNLNHNGVSGDSKFDNNGDVIKSLEIMIIKNKKAIKNEEK